MRVSLFIQMAERVCKVIILSDVTLAELVRSVSLRPTATQWFCLMRERTAVL